MNKENSFFSGFEKKQTGKNNQLYSFLAKEVGNIQKYKQCLELLLGNIQTQKHKCQSNISRLEKQLENLQRQSLAFKKNNNAARAAETIKNQLHEIHIEIMKKTKQRIELAEKICLKNFKKLSLDDRKSKANQLFKWILVCFYDEPQSKYYWPNFQVECFENDNGIDFKERLGKISALKAKEHQKVKTQYFIKNYQQIRAQKELKIINGDMDILLKIAELFRESLTLAQQQALKRSQLTSTSQQKQEIVVKIDQQQARAQAYKDRISISKAYLATLNNFQKQFTSKIKQYQYKISCFDNDSNVSNSKLPFKVIDNLQQKQQNSQCTIY